MKIPVNGAWKVLHDTDKGVSVLATKNITFDERGFARLAPRTADVFDTTDDADFEIPVGAYYDGSISKLAATDGHPFSVDIDSMPLTINEDGLAGQPSGSIYTGTVRFAGAWVFFESNDMKTYNGSTWTDRTPAFTNASRTRFGWEAKNTKTLCVTDGNTVKQYDSSYTAGTGLSLPSGEIAIAGAYNNSYSCIVTRREDGEDGSAYIWDHATSAANYAYPLDARRAYFVIPYQNGWAALTSRGELIAITAGGTRRLETLPSYWSTAILGDDQDVLDVAGGAAAIPDGERIHFFINGMCASKNQEPNRYNPMQPSGMWTYDPDIGLYHRGAPSGARLLVKVAATSDINTGTGAITTTATVPETGTEVVYSGGSTGAITGLNINQSYWTIKLSSTTFKLATTQALALAGTSDVNMTAVGATSSYYFAFLQTSDFGQLATDGYGGLLTKTGASRDNTASSFFSLYARFAYGFGDVNQLTAGAAVDSFGFFLDRGENRGYIVFQKMFSPNVTDVWQKLVAKVRGLETVFDQVIVKTRVVTIDELPIIARSSTDIATWTSQTTFTTTADLSLAKTAFDADDSEAYEIEFILGAGSGYLAHISAITLLAGTYTVTIDETIRGIGAGNTSYFIVDNWTKRPDADGEMAITKDSDSNGVEFPIADISKWVQIKLELRGSAQVAIEELALVNASNKPEL